MLFWVEMSVLSYLYSASVCEGTSTLPHHVILLYAWSYHAVLRSNIIGPGAKEVVRRLLAEVYTKLEQVCIEWPSPAKDVSRYPGREDGLQALIHGFVINSIRHRDLP